MQACNGDPEMLSEVRINRTNLALVQGNLTKQETDAIVNAANPSLMGGGGVDGAIHRAGGSAIQTACKQIVKTQGRLLTGKAVITTGGNLAAKFVIHTVGPVWRGGGNNEAELLASAYQESLRLATAHRLTSIAFPSISTGAYGYPVELAAKVALTTIIAFLQTEPTTLTEVILVLFDSGTYRRYHAALAELIMAEE